MTCIDGTLVPFDLETTGTDPEQARIVTAAVSRVHVATGHVDSWVWLADPGVEIPAEATAVHGITTDHARDSGRPATEVIVEVAAQIQKAWKDGYPLVVYNAPYDLTVLDRELRRIGDEGGLLALTETGLPGPVIDPLVLDRACDRYRRGSRKLVDVCAHYGIPVSTEDTHTSSGDALAAARLTWKLCRRFPELDGLTLDELQTRQAVAHREWAAHFEDYLRATGSPQQIDRSWPICNVAAAVAP
jgi:DNA polymerase-3 subunit epsilon